MRVTKAYVQKVINAPLQEAENLTIELKEHKKLEPGFLYLIDNQKIFNLSTIG